MTTKLSALTPLGASLALDDLLLVTDITNLAQSFTVRPQDVLDLLSGDVSVSAGVLSIAAGAVGAAELADEAYTTAEKSKLAGIEAGATADQTAGEIEAIVSHDNLLGYVAAEHVDWAGASAGTIHVTNIADGSLTLAKLANMATASLLGRNTAGAGVPEVLSAATVRTILNVEDGATADQTGAEIKALYEGEANTNAFTDAEQTKLAAITGTNTGDEPAASLTVAGIVELATVAETDTGTDATRAVTPAGLKGSALQTKVDGIEAGADVTSTQMDTVTGDVTFSSLVSTIAAAAVTTSKIQAGAVTLDRMANISTSSILGRVTAATGTPEVLSAAQVRTLLNVSDGADVTSTVLGTVTGDVTFAGTVSSIANDAVTLAKLASGTAGNLITYDASGNPAAVATGTAGHVLTSNGAGAAPTFQASGSGVTDHGLLTGLGDDDHTQYLLANGTRNLTGNLTVSALVTIDGRDLSVDGTKLDGIESGADVTDATNVAAAGAIMDSDISAGEGFMRKTGTGTYEAIKSNLAGTASPTANEDSGDGYAVGSLWVDTTNDHVWKCVDATAAAAVWVPLSVPGYAVIRGDNDDTSGAVSTAVTFTQVTDFTTDVIEDGIICDADQANNKIIAKRTGIYRAFYSASVYRTSGGASPWTQGVFAISVGGTEETGGRAVIDTNGVNLTPYSASGETFINVTSANTDITLEWKCDAAESNKAQFTELTLGLQYIG